MTNQPVNKQTRREQTSSSTPMTNQPTIQILSIWPLPHLSPVATTTTTKKQSTDQRTNQSPKQPYPNFKTVKMPARPGSSSRFWASEDPLAEAAAGGTCFYYTMCIVLGFIHWCCVWMAWGWRLRYGFEYPGDHHPETIRNSLKRCNHSHTYKCTIT